MTLLDDLKSQAADIKAAELATREEQQAQEEFYTLKLRPVMIRARDYLDEIIKNLNIIDTTVECSYAFDPNPLARVAFTQSEYDFDYNDARNPRQLEINCKCRLQQPTEFYVATKEGVEQHARLLEDHNMPHHQRNQLDELYTIRGATFILTDPLPARIRILSSPADRCIYVDFRNFEDEPSSRYRFDPAELTDEMLEKIVRILLREESKLVRIELSEEYREELQKQLEKDRLRKKREEAGGLAAREAERLRQEKERLINRTKSAVSVATQKMSEAVATAKNKLRSKD